jgi:hypothetical protein
VNGCPFLAFSATPMGYIKRIPYLRFCLFW